jgi:hypothetical protein
MASTPDTTTAKPPSHDSAALAWETLTSPVPRKPFLSESDADPSSVRPRVARCTRPDGSRPSKREAPLRDGEDDNLEEGWVSATTTKRQRCTKGQRRSGSSTPGSPHQQPDSDSEEGKKEKPTKRDPTDAPADDLVRQLIESIMPDMHGLVAVAEAKQEALEFEAGVTGGEAAEKATVSVRPPALRAIKLRAITLPPKHAVWIDLTEEEEEEC